MWASSWLHRRRGGAEPGPYACLLVAALLFAVTPASADVLVLHDGSRVESAGAWEQRGPMIVFRTTDGRLASLQARQVDLEASREATEAAKAAAAAAATRAAAPPPEKKPILVLTDADVAHVFPSAGGDAEEAVDEEAPAEGERLAVVEWVKVPDPDLEGVTIRGRVRNTSEETVGGIRLEIGLYDGEGTRVAAGTAPVRPPSLPPGAEGRFELTVTDAVDFAAARFDISSTALATAQQPPAEVPRRPEEE